MSALLFANEDECDPDGVEECKTGITGLTKTWPIFFNKLFTVTHM
jgi:hypothetical protein